MKNKTSFYDIPKYRDLKDVVYKTEEKYSQNTAFIVKKVDDKKNVTYKNITYKEVKEDMNALGTALLSLGLKGKKVAVISPNRYEWVISYLSVVNGVGIIVPLDRSLPSEEIARLLRRSSADAVIFDKKYAESIKKIKDTDNDNNVKYYICMDEDVPEFLSYSKLIEKGRKLIEDNSEIYREYAECEIDPNEMKILLYTSGTTAMAKAVMLSHENIVSDMYGINAVIKVYENDISLSFLPMHHTLGAIAVWFLLANGATTAFCDGLKYIQANLKEYKATVFVTVPLLIENMYKKIMKNIDKQGKTEKVQKGKEIANALLKIKIDIRRKIFKEIIDNLGGGLRIIVSGAAGLDKDVAEALNDFGIETVQGYGLTETSPVICVENDKYRKPGTCGFPLKNVEIEIEDKDEKGVGELKVKGPIVMLGYYEMEEETKNVLKDEWFYTGDLAYIDEEGYVHISGRKKDVIVLKNGKNIYPEELEKLIDKLPYVVESLVFGYPDGNDLIVSAKIVISNDYINDIYPNKSQEEVEELIWKDIKKINMTLSNYKHIKKMMVTDEPMIKTTTAKIKRFVEIEKIINSKTM